MKVLFGYVFTYLYVLGIFVAAYVIKWICGIEQNEVFRKSIHILAAFMWIIIYTHLYNTWHFRDLIEQAQGHPDGFLPMLLLFTGLRRGEAIGLRWEDIHDGYIHVQRSAYFENNTTIIKDTKTKAAKRNIPINDVIAEKLSQNGEGYVFGNDVVWTESKYKRTWERLRKTIPVLSNVTAHILRHTYTMLLRRANVDSATAQYLLGHEDYSTTANVYTHIGADDLAEAVKKMVGILPQIVPHGISTK